jgi:hypothetical protein
MFNPHYLMTREDIEELVDETVEEGFISLGPWPKELMEKLASLLNEDITRDEVLSYADQVLVGKPLSSLPSPLL